MRPTPFRTCIHNRCTPSGQSFSRHTASISFAIRQYGKGAKDLLVWRDKSSPIQRPPAMNTGSYFAGRTETFPQTGQNLCRGLPLSRDFIRLRRESVPGTPGYFFSVSSGRASFFASSFFSSGCSLLCTPTELTAHLVSSTRTRSSLVSITMVSF